MHIHTYLACLGKKMHRNRKSYFPFFFFFFMPAFYDIIMCTDTKGWQHEPQSGLLFAGGCKQKCRPKRLCWNPGRSFVFPRCSSCSLTATQTAAAVSLTVARQIFYQPFILHFPCGIKTSCSLMRPFWLEELCLPDPDASDKWRLWTMMQPTVKSTALW